MRLVFIFSGALVAVLAVFLWLRPASRATVWAKEPKVYLGVQLGKPLAASVPNCLPDDTRLCFDGTFIANEPDPLGGTTPFIEEGIVSQVNTTFRSDAEELIEQDLKEKYGPPGVSIGDTKYWNGKFIEITLTASKGEHIGFLDAALVHSPSSSQPPHKNPF